MPETGPRREDGDVTAGVVTAARMTPGTVPIIEGDRVRLRPLRLEDVDALVVLCRDPRTQRFVPVPVEYGRADARHFVEDAVPAGWRDGTAHQFAVADVGNDRLLGTIGIHHVRAATADVGITIGPAIRRRGVGSAACALILDYAFEGLGLTTLYWQAYVGNHASRALAARLGFRYLAELPAFASLRGNPTDVWMFVLASAEWQAERAARTGGPA